METNMKGSTFEYIDGDSIDEELKCAICFRALNCPVSNPKCGHTFCQECVETWHENSSICPTCRQHVRMEDYTPVTTRAVLNRLSRLHLKCNLCKQVNIDDRMKHIAICPKQTVQCPSADIQCQWEGKREELQLHFDGCAFQRIRPIIDQLIEEIQTIKQTQYEQYHFIQAFINSGYTLSHQCSMPHCSLKGPFAENKPRLMPCSLCNEQIPPQQIALHSCITINCICKSCLEKFHNQQKPPVQLNLKRKLFTDEENHHSRPAIRRRSPSPPRLRSRLRLRSPPD